MKLTNELLLKYAEGRLYPGLEAQVKALLASNDEARERLRLIERSGAALQAEIRDRKTTQETDPLATLILSRELDPPRPRRTKTATRPHAQENEPSKPWSGLQIAASVALLAIGLTAGYYLKGLQVPGEEQSTQANPAWLVRVVDYHTLYIRETVASAHTDLKGFKQLKKRFSGILGHPVTIPDLRTEQLEFRRGQYLKFEDSPVIQLAYLPEKTGRPVALCLKASKAPDSQPQYALLNGLGVVRWQQDGLDYVLVGDLPENHLRRAAKNARLQIAIKG